MTLLWSTAQPCRSRRVASRGSKYRGVGRHLDPAVVRRTAVLLRGGRGDGVAVVTADEEHRRAKRGREVERRMEVALARCALAEVGHGHRRLAFQLQRIEVVDSLRMLWLMSSPTCVTSLSPASLLLTKIVSTSIQAPRFTQPHATFFHKRCASSMTTCPMISHLAV